MKAFHRATLLVSGLLLLSVSGCEGKFGAADDDDKPAAASKTVVEEYGLKLDAEQREKLGIVTTAAANASFLAETPGFGVVLSHEPIAVASAELSNAQLALRQSQAALARAKQLSGTPGALPTETIEAAERQAATDAAALTLAEHRLTALLGQGAPSKAPGQAWLTELAGGQVKLVRVTFPLGTLPAALPKHVRLTRLDSGATGRNWVSDAIWDAPADTTIPGRSFFTLLRAADVSEGERLQAWASSSATVKGIVVPAAAVIQYNSAYWCYVAKPDGSLSRVLLDTSRPAPSGYFVSEGIAPGDEVVSTGAGLLLAREINPSAEADE